jgi:tape measure domain-containing protein
MSTVLSEIRLRIRAEGEKVLVDLGAKLNDIANKTTLSSNNFKGLAAELKQLQQTTVQSTRNIKDYSASWRELASSVDISSKEFKQATAEANALDARLKTFQGVQTTVAANFHNIASAAKQASAAMQTATGLIRDPLTGAYRGTAGKTQYDAPIGPVAPPDTAGRYAQQQREADAQLRRDARRRETMQQRAAYFGDISGGRDPRTGAIIAGGMGPFQGVGTQYARPIGPALPSPPRRRFAGAAQTAGAIAASGVFGGPEGLAGAGIGAIVGGPMGAAAGGAIGAQVGMLRQAIGETATYASEITKLNIALKGITKTSQEYSDAQNAINSISKSLNVPIKEATSGFTKLSASVIGAGGNVNDAEIVFRGITTAIKGTGGGAAEVQGALLAMSQVFSKGKVTAEELSGQLGERLPGAVTAFAKATGRTLPQLQKDLENGVVGLNDVIKFAIALETQHSETAKKVASSSEESGARMTVALDEVKLAIGSAFQPIGSKFQESITEAAKVSIVGVKIITNELKSFNKEIEKAFGKENVQSMGEGIKFLFTTMVDEASKVLNPMHQIASLLKRVYDTTPQGKLSNAGVEATYTDAQGNVYDTATGRFLRKGKPKGAKAPTKFEEPKGKDDDAGAKKAAKEAAELKRLTDANAIQERFQRGELIALKDLALIKDQINNILATETEETKKNNVEKLKKLRLQALDVEYLIKGNQLAVTAELAYGRTATEPNRQIGQAQAQGIKQNYDTDIKKLMSELNEKRKDVLNGITKENTKQTEATAKQLTDSQRLFLVLQDQLAIARATTPEEKIRLESKARINELDRDTVQLNDQQQDQAVRLQNTENLKSQILLEQINLKERLAALDPLQQFITQSTTQLENLKGVAVSVSQGIGEALGNSISSGIQGLVEGTANAQQIFSDFLKSIGQILIQEGTKMIATYTAIAIAKSLAGLFGGGGGAIKGGDAFGGAASSSIFSAGTGTAFGGMSIPGFAEGGNPPIGRPSLVGEKGPELFVPSSAGKIIPADTTAAMARYQRQGGSSGGNSSSDAMGAEAAATPVLSMSFETTRFLGQDYVSTDQLQAAMMATEKRAAAAGAKAGAAQVTSKLQQSPSYRRQVGLR